MRLQHLSPFALAAATMALATTASTAQAGGLSFGFSYHGDDCRYRRSHARLHIGWGDRCADRYVKRYTYRTHRGPTVVYRDVSPRYHVYHTKRHVVRHCEPTRKIYRYHAPRYQRTYRYAPRHHRWNRHHHRNRCW